ncbi:hypothetical protein [Kibdelosporangium phytohabitans]|uniref:hypothetical protein n=1 Tax=Kibdelosporangium phytohabitans TaxID=860235 RepID=UPI0012FC2716|nr:hypothetical protein [Kibdelosporangium phytohabitans]
MMIAIDGDPARLPPGKFRYGGVLLEVSAMSTSRLSSPEAVLSDYHLAGNLHLPGILADPTGHLTALHTEVARRFGDNEWIQARCTDAMNRIRDRLTTMDTTAPLPGQVTNWLFGTGVTTHVLLVAALRNPTIRRRYTAVRELLRENDKLDYHEHLLHRLGSANLTQGQVTDHLNALTTVFDAATAVTADYRFASDITESARPTGIDASHDSIAAGLHREAVFWIVATYCRCLTKLSLADRPIDHRLNAFHALLADLGALTADDRRKKADWVLADLPGLTEIALALVLEGDVAGLV